MAKSCSATTPSATYPEILIAHQDDPRMHVMIGEDRPPRAEPSSGVEAEREAARTRCRRAGAMLTVLEPGSDGGRGQLDVQPRRLGARAARSSGSGWRPQARGRGLGTAGAARWPGAWLFDGLRPGSASSC